MNYGFVIDNRKCIGCHACSTACKSENEVPLGVNRTWVKYVETGAFPDVTRHFQVTRCNHCASPPCVRICPVTAMYQRTDGIVEFDAEACIGCKACMQACPYDAIYIDPDSHTAAKCHFCAHRIELELEPASVVVCPEHAIIAGDMDDPQSEIAQLLATQNVTVRKPEQGTAPKLFYIHGNEIALHPTATQRTPQSILWADVIPLHATANSGGWQRLGLPLGAEAAPQHHNGHAATAQPMRAPSGAAIRTPQSQGSGARGPIQIASGRMAEQMVQVSYDAQHRIPWHWPVPAYLVTKAAGCGLFALLALGFGLNWLAFEPPIAMVMGFASLLALATTAGLLVYDLERPERFLTILTRPQWKSWLTRGAFLLLGFSLLSGLWWLSETLAVLGWLAATTAETLRPWFLWLGLPLAIGTAIYTAFLFGQAEGRDLWQSPLLPVHLVIQALVAGCALFLALAVLTPVATQSVDRVRVVLGVALAVDLFVLLAGEFGMSHASEAAAQAAHAITHGVYRRIFWLGGVVVGHLVPLALLLVGWSLLWGVAGLASLAGLYWFEYTFVMAPQDVPNS